MEQNIVLVEGDKRHFIILLVPWKDLTGEVGNVFKQKPQITNCKEKSMACSNRLKSEGKVSNNWVARVPERGSPLGSNGETLSLTIKENK